MSHIHKAGLNKAGLEDRSTDPGNPPLSGLLISLDALLLPGFSPHFLGVTLCPHTFGML